MKYRKYWVRPQHASCIEGNDSIAWKCNSGYVDLYYKGINTCVKKDILKYVDGSGSVSFTENEKQVKLTWDAIQNKRGIIISDYSKKIENWSSVKKVNFRDSLIEARQKISTSNYSQKTIDLATFVLDDLANSVDNQVNQQTKDLQDVQSSFAQLQLYANNGYIGDFQSKDYAGASRSKIEQEAYVFSQKIEEYLFTYSNEYKAGLTSYTGNDSGDSSDIERGAREGVVEGKPFKIEHDFVDLGVNNFGIYAYGPNAEDPELRNKCVIEGNYTDYYKLIPFEEIYNLMRDFRDEIIKWEKKTGMEKPGW